MPTGRLPLRRPSFTTALGAAAVFGLVLRLVTVAAGQGGLTTHVHPGYDESVYVGAAWLVRSGALPYRDFVFVFPPGFLALLVPIAGVASWFGGPALTVTLVRVLAAIVGALNVWLVGRIARPWLGPTAGLLAALLYATLPIVVQTEASVLQEPFVNLGLLLAVLIWAQRADEDRSVTRLLGAGLLVGAAISMKLVAGVVVVPLLVVGPFVQPVADRVRFAIAACVPLAVSSGLFALLVGWRPVWEQAVEAQVLRGHDGEGLARVRSMLPLLRGQVGVTTYIGPGSWIAVVIFVAMCAAAIWRGGRVGRLWGAIGVTFLVTLMAAPSYFAHYGVLLAPAAVLVTSWVLCCAAAAIRSPRRRVAVSTAVLAVVALAVVATQTVTTVQGLPVGLGQLPRHLGQVVSDDGAPSAGRVSLAIEHLPVDACIVAVRPQVLLDVDRVPSADRKGHVLLDVFGTSLLAAQQGRRRPVDKAGAVAYSSVQTEIVHQSRQCGTFLIATRRCRQGRKDLSAASEGRLDSRSKLIARSGCIQLRREVGTP